MSAATGAPGKPAMHVSFLYDMPLPCRFAAAIQILNTARALACRGIATTVHAGPLAGDTAACLAYYGLEPHENLFIQPLFCPPARQFGLRWRLPRSLAAIERRGPHVIVTRGESGLAVMPLLQRLRPNDASIVYEAHRLCFAHAAERRSGRAWASGQPLDWRTKAIRRREQAALAAADGIVCLTRGVEATLRREFEITQPTMVLPSGTTVVDGDPQGAGPTMRDIDVLYAGKLAGRKGVSLLIEAMAHLPDRRLWVVGGAPGEVETCREVATRHGVADRVTFTGFVEPHRVRDYLDRARVGVCPLPTGVSVTSESFTSPLKILELMAAGVPVVASDLPSVRELAGEPPAVLLVRPDDAESLATGIRRVLDDADLARRLKDSGRRRVDGFAWAERARRLHAFLEMLIHEPGKAIQLRREEALAVDVAAH